MADCSMANSRLRMLVKEGLLWGFGLQHSEDQKTRAHLLLFLFIYFEKMICSDEIDSM